MMKLDFTKMNGAGNDFVMLDNRSGEIRLSREQIALICDRHRGVGADGLLLVEPSKNADFHMRYYNADGGEAEMCGNGARCFARFVQKIGGGHEQVCFETLAGIIHAKIMGEKVQINLSSPHGLRLRERIPLKNGEVEAHSINTGVPHAVLWVTDADRAMVGPVGSEIRYHPHFAPKGTNVNFVQQTGPGKIRVRTYERGVEAETLACGTGVAASALIAHEILGFPSPIQVRVQGGDTLEVGFQKKGNEFQEVTLKGPAAFAFEGRMEV